MELNDITIKMKNYVNAQKIVYVYPPKLRKQITKYLIGTKIRTYRTDKDVKKLQNKNWMSCEKRVMLQKITSGGYKHYSDFIAWTDKLEDKLLKQSCGDLCRGLSNYIPLYQLVNYNIIQTVLNIKEFNYDDIQKKLIDNNHILYAIMARSHDTGKELPECFYSLMIEVASKSQSLIQSLGMFKKTIYMYVKTLIFVYIFF